MDYATGTARLVEPGNLEGRGVAAVLDRSEIEQALRSKESTELILDVARQGDVEAHTLGVRWDPPDLEEVLRTTEGDRIAIAFDREELQDALSDADVEGHGLRGTAPVLSVAVATATAGPWAAPHGMVAGGGSSGSASRSPRSAVRSPRLAISPPAEVTGAAISTADQPIGGAVAASGDQSPAETTGAAISTADQPIGGAVAASGDQSPAETTGAAISTADQPIGGAVAASGDQSPRGDDWRCHLDGRSADRWCGRRLRR